MLKNLILASVSCLIVFHGFAQDCNTLFVDISKGTLNDLKPTATQDEVKQKFPCSTGFTPDHATIDCGGGVFFAKNNFFFYTNDDFIEIRKGFTGTFSTDLFDKSEVEITKILGKNVGGLRDDNGKYLYYKMSYGAIILRLVKDKVDKIFIYYKSPDDVELCI